MCRAVFLMIMTLTTAMTVNYCGRMMMKLNGIEIEKRREAECVKFLPESFRKTCDGSGFETLNEWRDSCKEMWNLETVKYTQNELMVDEDVWNGNGGTLFIYHGEWSGRAGSGEVYAKGGR